MSNKQTYQCSYCGTTVYRFPSQAVGKSVYCSQSCVGKSKQHGTVLRCFQCHKEFYRRIGEQDLDSRVNQFCSRSCYMEWRADNRKYDTYPKDGARHIHRILAEQYLGRPLTESEIVHHIDLDRHNIDPTNLAVLPNQSYHMRVHLGKISIDEVRRLSLK